VKSMYVEDNEDNIFVLESRLKRHGTGGDSRVLVAVACSSRERETQTYFDGLSLPVTGWQGRRPGQLKLQQHTGNTVIALTPMR